MTTPTTTANDSAVAAEDQGLAFASQWRLMWLRFRRHRLAMGGGGVLLFLYFGAAFCEFLAPLTPAQRHRNFVRCPPQEIRFVDALGAFHARPFIYGVKQRPDAGDWQREYVPDRSVMHPVRFFVHGPEYEFWGLIRTDWHLFGAGPQAPLFLFGTDELGRVLFTRILHGSRVSLTIGLVGVALTFFIGILLGGIAGYFGGWVDIVVQRGIEILMAIPQLPLWMALSAALPGHWPPLHVYFGITIILSFMGWTGLARVVRGRFLSLREEDFVVAARLAGTGELKIIFWHLLPSFLSHVITAATLAVPGMILGETALKLSGDWSAGPGGQLGGAAATGAELPGRRHGALAADAGRVCRHRRTRLQRARRRHARRRRPLRQLMADTNTAASRAGEALLEVSDLHVRIERDTGAVRPLNGVSFAIEAGQSVGIVGESGCGKTMASNALLRILPRRSEITGGSMLFRTESGERVDLARIDPSSRQMRQIRGGEISMIFQEPMTAFSPVHTVHNQIAEMIRLHDDVDEQQRRGRVVELLDLVGIPNPELRADDYFQLSGGLRQRAMIAMALASGPRLLIADEPTTALDVTVQARVLKLIERMQRELDLALMLITHDLGVVAHMVSYVYVMYLGRVVEEGPVEKIFDTPAHPYTAALLRSIPNLAAKSSQRLEPIEGYVPSADNMPSGCPFHTRCREQVGDICQQRMPERVEVAPRHFASCYKHTERSVDDDG